MIREIISSVNALPITVDQAKQHMRVTTAADDSYIEMLIGGVSEVLQGELRLCFFTTQYKLTFGDEFAGLARPFARTWYQPIKLTPGPCKSVDSITVGGTATEDYKIIDHDPFTIAPLWDLAGDVVITFTTGFGADAAALPKAIPILALLLTADLYATREVTVEARAINQNPNYLRFVNSQRDFRFV